MHRDKEQKEEMQGSFLEKATMPIVGINIK